MTNQNKCYYLKIKIEIESKSIYTILYNYSDNITIVVRGRIIARKTLKLGANEYCEWNVNPLLLVKGKLCGG
jgi:glutaredoxin-related protein